MEEKTMEESSVASSFLVQKDDQCQLHDDAFMAFPPQFGSSIDPGSVEGMQALNKNGRRYNYKEKTKQRKLNAIVNKLSPQNFDRLIQQVKDVNIDTVVTLTGVISLIFQTLDATTSETYANFCIHLHGVLPVFSTGDETITFKKLLVSQCQKEFQQGGREEVEDNRVEKLKEEDMEDMEEKVKSRRRWIGNIQLIGELYKKRMFPEVIMHVCIVELLKKEDGEALSILMRIIGEEIDSLRSKRLMDAFFYMMQELSNDQKLPSRERFILKDTIDLRKNKWHQRKFERVETQKVYRGTSKELSSVPRRMFHAGSGFGSTSSGRIIDRASGGSRNDRRGSGIVDDKWGKAPGSFGPGRDPRMDGTHGGMAVNFRPGQAGNHGVLRNPRGQSSGQYVDGILSGPMQGLASPGGMARNSPDVDRWQHSKGLIPSPLTPLQAMHKAERKLEIGVASDKEGDKQRQLEAILNKLTPLNFEKQFAKIKEVDIDSAVTLTALVSRIFDRAVMNPTSCEMYANLCHHLAGAFPDFSEDNEKITFKRLLLNKCQEEFERGEREQAEANRVEEGEIKQSAEEREEKRVKARKRMLGNIQLIGELYNKKMLTERIMHECIKKLLGQYQNPDEEDIEALCKLMSTIGEMIDHPKAKEHMDAYFEAMLKLSNNQKLSYRVRFMLKDTIDLRNNKWHQRRKFDWVETKEVYSDTSKELSPLGSRASQSHAGYGINYAGRGKQTRHYPQGPASLSSQFSLPKRTLYDLPHQGSQCMTRGVWFEDGHPSESRTLPGSFPRRPARVQSPMPSIPLADVSSTWAPSDLRSISMATIREYYGVRDDDEVRLCIKELNAPRFNPKMIKLWIEDSFDRVNDVDRDLLAKLLVKLSNSNDISRAQLIFGFKSVLSILEDAVIDSPNAAKYFGRILGKVIVLESIFCLTLIGNLILKGGSEPGRLVQIGIASDILLSILDTIRAETGESVLNEMWTGSNLRLEDFQAPDTSESLSFEEFIQKMNL